MQSGEEEEETATTTTTTALVAPTVIDGMVVENGSSSVDVASVNQQAGEDTETTEAETESDEHLPRVQVELDKLNYANESINSLELELEESKREYLTTMQESEEQLAILEKRLGVCVEKSRPYYEARIELSEAKDKYLKVKSSMII